jgi:hypothetical protein
MNTIVIDDVVKVEYQEGIAKLGQLTNIHVVFGKTGHIANYSGPGLLLALNLLKDQFPPKTDAERDLIKHPHPSPVRLGINPDTLELFLPNNLDTLSYVQLFAAYEQMHHFNFFESKGRQFGTDPLLSRIQEALKLKQPKQ